MTFLQAYLETLDELYFRKPSREGIEEPSSIGMSSVERERLNADPRVPDNSTCISRAERAIGDQLVE